MVEMPQEPIAIKADPARFMQIVSNVVGNAARYTPQGGEIRVRVAAPDAYLRIEIADNGIGIPADRQAGIFNMFEQSDSRIRSDGLGIGLALVKQLVELHGGTIRLQKSEPGEGSTFEIRLPLAT